MNLLSNKELKELKKDIEKDGDYSPITWICEFGESFLAFTKNAVYKCKESKEK